jgi:hypothetical protein
MAEPRQVTFRLEEPLRVSAAAGRHNFINLMAGVLEGAGYRIEFADLSAPVRSPSLTHMAAPPDDRGLVFRRAYHYPFWQIDPLPQRWHWAVARRPFDAVEVPKDASRFFDFWRRRLFGEAPFAARRGGFLYLPLQGHLRRQRSFQRCTPLEMVAAVAETGRQAVVTLHPKEAYAAADRAALAALVARHDNLRLGTDDMVTLLRDCDGVVTMNSAVAFSGYFFEKPALLYAGADFHHIALQGDLARVSKDLSALDAHRPPFAKYIYWFWQMQAINAGRPEGASRIAERLRNFGWDL